LTILPKRWGPGAVGQFQRRFRNCHLHSRTALCSPPLTLCRIPGFWRISRRCLRLSSCRLGSSTSCRLLESVSRFVEEATFTMPLVGRIMRAQIREGDLHPTHKGCAYPVLCLRLCAWRELLEINNKVMTKMFPESTEHPDFLYPGALGRGDTGNPETACLSWFSFHSGPGRNSWPAVLAHPRTEVLRSPTHPLSPPF
jgi:hypothetical protein